MNKKAELDNLVKTVLWIVLFIMLVTGLYFLLNFLTNI
jgi:hypothetical protein